MQEILYLNYKKVTKKKNKTVHKRNEYMHNIKNYYWT